MFLELTQQNGIPITVNTDRIVHLEPEAGTDCAIVYFGSIDANWRDSVSVTESYTAVLAAMTPYTLVVRATEVAAIADEKN